MSRFLQVSLNIKTILQETTLHRRREKLGTMIGGLGLGDAYSATIGRIKAQGVDRTRLGMAALMWISHSQRPLSADEICHALAVEIGSTDINPNNVPSIKTVLSCCQGLAAIDEGALAVRLIHFTLKEYLSRHADLFEQPHSKIAETCLTYLKFQAINAPPAKYPRVTPFLTYSSMHWGTHMRMELSDHSRFLALDLFDRYDSHISAEICGWFAPEQYRVSPRPFSVLRCISYFGIGELAIDLLRTKGWDVNQGDRDGMTLLMWAARYGHEELVRLLLQQRHTRPDMADTKYGRTALSWAAESGHEGVVRLFLGLLFVNPSSIGRRWGKTPQIMSLLFGRKYVNPDRPDNDGRTPLSWAASGGHDGVVKLLLGREDACPDRPDKDGQTPLLWAARCWHDGAVKLLLGREDVRPDRPDKRGLTPLIWATLCRRKGMLELLQAREATGPSMIQGS